MSSGSANASPTVEDVIYHSPDGNDLTARLYRPVGAGPWPAVVDIHGGRWCAEDRLTNHVIDEALARAGIFVMAIDFRLPPVAKYPGPVADIAYAFKWLARHAAELGVRADAIGGVGTSSGGHQLLLNALTPSDPRWSSGHPKDSVGAIAPLAFAVVCWPVTDPVARYAYARANDMDIHVRSHQAYWPDEAAMAEGSPLRIVSEGCAEHLPPLLIIQGTNDVILTPDMNDRFAIAYAAAGGSVRLEKFAGEGHTFITKKPGSDAAVAALGKIIAFIRDATPPSGAA